MSVTEILLDILVVLLAAKVGAEVSERLRIPAVVGEIVAGMVVGPSLLGLVGHTEVLEVLGELGVILLLLQVGLEMDVKDLAAVGRASMTVAVIGVALPMASGFLVSEAFEYDFNTALFLGAALAATSVGITARVFSDLRALASVEARTVLGAAVADDVLGLVILTVVVRVVTEGSVSLATVLSIVGVAVLFLVVTALVGVRFAPPLFRAVQRYSLSAGTLVALALAFTLGFAELADAAKLAPIVGAFVAGLALSRSDQRERIERELTPVGHLFIPVFFLQIGISIDISSFAQVEVLEVAGALFVVAMIGKLAAALGTFRSPGDKWLIGLGMVPRGEVGLIFATIGLREGVLGDDLYASLLLVVLATTLVTPPLLRMRLLRLQRGSPEGLVATTPMPEGGWLRIDDGVVDLAGAPPTDAALAIGLQAAEAVAAGARPGADLLDWLGGLGTEPLRWSVDATERLLDLLAEGDERTWRFLETTGVLERGLPELAEAVRRRRADPYLVDPRQVLRFDLVEAVQRTALDPGGAKVHRELRHPEWLLLAALILDAAGEDSTPVDFARRLVQRLDLGSAAEESIALLVEDAGLLRAAAGRVESLQEENVLQLTTHLEDPERARALYLLSLALAPLAVVERARLDQLFELVLAALERPSLTGREVRDLVAQRRAEATRHASNPLVRDRIEHAPRAYVLSQDPADLACQAALLVSLPRRSEVRVAVREIDGDLWRLDVAARDRPGLLAAVSGALVGLGSEVVEAAVATWPDGGALETFRVRAADRPDPEAIERAVRAALTAPPVAESIPDATIEFDDAASPWYTRCEVRSADRPGLLHSIAVCLAAAGASVHSARLHVEGDVAVDRFELTDDRAQKLDRETKEAVRRALREGVQARRRRGLGRLARV